MKRVYIKPMAEELCCDMSGMLAASTKKTEWEMNTDGNNGTGINNGTNNDPDADAREFGGFFDEY